jgi:hypothetical protein
MRALWSILLLLPSLIPTALCLAAQEIPPLRLGPLSDRILFLVALWVLIAALLVTLRWKINLADALYRMMPRNEGAKSKETQRGNPQLHGKSKTPAGKPAATPNPSSSR